MRQFFIVSSILVALCLETQLIQSQTTPKEPESKRVEKDQPRIDSPSAQSNNFIQNTTVLQPDSNFNISGNGNALGTLSGTAVNAALQFNLRNQRVLSGTVSLDNLFVGFGVGADNTASTQNVFVGANIGPLNTGNRNAFFGWDAGTANTTGNLNSFFGASAGNSNTEGGFNSFFGHEAGRSNTDKGFNSFFGANAGALTSGGGGNSFFGALSGHTNSSGRFNSFFGYLSGAASHGSHNSFFGQASGEGNLNGSNNTFVGFRAGHANFVGDNNTTIGSEADVGSGDLSFATAIGAGSVATISNSIFLGRSGGQDTVRIPGPLTLGTLGVGMTNLCFGSFGIVGTCSSSARYKSNITTFGSGLDLIRRLRPVSFNWKEGGMRDIGLIAEEVNRIEPLLITTNSIGQIEGVKYDRVSVVLINAIQEQQAEIESQRKEIGDLRLKVGALMKIVCAKTATLESCKEEKK